MKIVFVRHGKTAWNEEGRYLGKTDMPLSDGGKEQLKEWKQEMPQEVACVLVSPMKRCLETAELLYETAEKIIIPEWSEIDFGVFEGKNYKELSGDAQYQQWIDSNGTLPFPNGESRQAFIARSLDGWNHAKQVLQGKIKQDNHLPQTVVAVVHGGTIMAVCSSVLGGDYFDYQVKNGEQICITI
ncbi:MAG: histidine phosphatase family protein [Eubacteriales bacterium]|nr:histidine phosphatase family protein [Eubacteriales bacterium]